MARGIAVIDQFGTVGTAAARSITTSPRKRK